MATDVNVTNSSVPVDNAAGQTVDVTVSNASIAVTSGSTLDVNITDTSINTRPSTANAASVTVNTSGAITNTELVAPAGGTQLIVTDIIFSNGGTAGDFTLESKNSTGPAYVALINKTYLAVNGGIVVNFTCPLVLTSGLGLSYSTTSTTTHSITVNYYTVT